MDYENINRTRGDTHPIRLTLTEDGATYDITGSSFILTVNPNESPDDDDLPLFSIAGVIEDAAGGVVTFTPTADDADNVGRFSYDIQQTDASGYVRTVLRGEYRVSQDITKNYTGTWTADDEALADGDPYPYDGYWRLVPTGGQPWPVFGTIDGRKVIRFEDDPSSIHPGTNTVRPRWLMHLGDSVEITFHSDFGRVFWYGWDPSGWQAASIAILDLRTTPDASISATTKNLDGSVESYSGVVDVTGWPNAGWFTFGLRWGLDGSFYFKLEREDSPVGWVAMGNAVPRLAIDTPVLLDWTFVNPACALRSFTWSREVS